MPNESYEFEVDCQKVDVAPTPAAPHYKCKNCGWNGTEGEMKADAEYDENTVEEDIWHYCCPKCEARFWNLDQWEEVAT